jgi:type III secretion protein R
MKKIFLSFLGALSLIFFPAEISAQSTQASYEQLAQQTAQPKTFKPIAQTSKESGKSAQQRFLESPIGIQAEGTPTLIIQVIALTGMALLPFLFMLITPFAKFVMVFSLLRNALGVQQVPPNQVINGIALILSIFVIFPVGVKMFKAAAPIIQTEAPESMTDPKAAQFIVKIADTAKEPLREFLIRNSLPAHQKNFYKIAFRMLPEDLKEYVTPDHFIVMIPAYITSQVKNGFEIGVLIYLPFFVIDLVVSNILLAMGMMMLSPVTISMPLKIFMLVMLDGWTLLTEGLILSYR